MTGALIGIALGLVIIITFTILKQFDKTIIYSLILTAIGFLYIGYTWSDITYLIVNRIQALVFLFLAYYGITRNANYMIAGYFLHGTWDFVYEYFANKTFLPPHYDWFCFSIDFLTGFYLLLIRNQLKGNSKQNG